MNLLLKVLLRSLCFVLFVCFFNTAETLIKSFLGHFVFSEGLWNHEAIVEEHFSFFSAQTDSVLMRLFGSTYSSELDAESPLAADSSTFKTSVSAKPSFLFLSLWFSRSSVRLLSSSRSHSSVRRLVFQAEHGAVDRCDAFLKPAFWNLLAVPLGLLPWHLTKIKI